jgi:gas vesicle protein
MMYEYKDLKYPGKTLPGVLVGVLIGGMAGALAMLLLAPRSGKETRRQIQKKGIELRDRTSEAAEERLAQVRTSGNRVTTEIKNYGQKLVAQQLDHVAEAMQAGIETVDRS